MKLRLTQATLVVAYGLSVVLANWLILHVGIPIPGGTHVIPIGFGLYAPSGSFVAALCLVLRDLLQRTTNRWMSLIVILPAAGVTALMNGHLAIASGTAFLLAETLDFAVYTPLQQRGLTLAVFASVAVGLVVDSFVFLTLAGIPLSIALPGLIVAKVYVLLFSLPAIRLGRRWIPTPVRVAA